MLRDVAVSFRVSTRGAGPVLEQTLRLPIVRINYLSQLETAVAGAAATGVFTEQEKKKIN